MYWPGTRQAKGMRPWTGGKDWLMKQRAEALWMRHTFERLAGVMNVILCEKDVTVRAGEEP